MNELDTKDLEGTMSVSIWFLVPVLDGQTPRRNPEQKRALFNVSCFASEAQAYFDRFKADNERLCKACHAEGQFTATVRLK
jgi:hypothetical protein